MEASEVLAALIKLSELPSWAPAVLIVALVILLIGRIGLKFMDRWLLSKERMLSLKKKIDPWPKDAERSKEPSGSA